MKSPLAQLGLVDSISIVVGIIVGVGIYETSPLIAAQFSHGWWLIAAWVLGGVLSLAGAFCYAELSTTYPEDGGDYLYLREGYGSIVAYLFAWSRVVIIRPGSIAAMAFPFATYAVALADPQEGSLLDSYGLLMFAVGSVFILTAMNSLAVSIGKGSQNLLTALKLIGLLFLCALPLFLYNVPLESIGAIASSSSSQSFGLALILILFTFGGWSEIAYVAGEVREPAKNLFRTLVYGTLLVTLLYVLVNLSFLSLLGLEGLANSKAVAVDAVRNVFPEWAGTAVSLLICISALGAIQGLIFTGARISYAFGLDYSLFRSLTYWDGDRGGPLIAFWVQAFISILIIVIAGSFENTIVYTTAVVWLFYFAVGASVIVLRYRHPNRDRPYKTFGYPVTVIIFSLTSLYLTYSAIVYDLYGTIIATTIMLAGLPLYYLSRK